MLDLLSNTTITHRVKVNKRSSDEVMDWLNEHDAVTAKQRTTDEFDIPPTAIVDVTVDLEELYDQ